MKEGTTMSRYRALQPDLEPDVLDKIFADIAGDMTPDEFLVSMVDPERITQGVKNDAKNIVYSAIGVSSNGYGHVTLIPDGWVETQVKQIIIDKIGDTVKKIITTKVNQVFARGVSKTLENRISQEIEIAYRKHIDREVSNRVDDMKAQAEKDVESMLRNMVYRDREDDGDLGAREILLQETFKRHFKEQL